jgi:hypothetical protein
MDISYTGGEMFASAHFTDDDAAGSGPSVGRAITNLLVVHMNDAASYSFTSTIKVLFDTYDEKWIEKMVKPVEELDRVSQLTMILKKLAHPMFNPLASWISHDITSPVHRERVETDICSAIGVSPAGFQSTLQSLHGAYQSTVQTMFELDGIIQTKLNRVETLHTQLSSLPTLSPELSTSTTLQTSISEYTEQMLEASNIHEEYPTFIHTVSLFHQLRSLLTMSSAFQEKELRNPCTICMNSEVEFVIVPCGHPFCKECCRKTRTICFLCRTPVLQKQKIFF